MERGRMLDGGTAPAEYADLDFQIASLEQRLGELYREKESREQQLEEAIRLRFDRLKVLRQQQSDAEIHLLNLLHRSRPNPCPAEILGAYERLEELLRSIQKP
jgi:hypothetical protein